MTTLGLSLSLSSGGGPSLPYTSDANTFLWNMAASNITTDGTGIASISDVPEMARGTSHSFIQATKASQPLLDANGARFTNGGGLNMETATGATPALNGATSFYVALLSQVDATAAANQNKMKIYDGGNKTRVGRFQDLTLTYAGSVGKAYIDDADGNSYTERTRPAVTTSFGTWYLQEWRHNVDTDTIEFWQNGVKDTSAILANAFTAASFPSTDSLGITIGGSLFGIIKALAVYDGAIPSANRQSISDYLLTLKP